MVMDSRPCRHSIKDQDFKIQLIGRLNGHFVMAVHILSYKLASMITQ